MDSATLIVLLGVLGGSGIVYFLSRQAERRTDQQPLEPETDASSRGGLAESVLIAIFFLGVFLAGSLLAPGPIAAVLLVAGFSGLFIVGVRVLSRMRAE